ncbi:SusC/RagA family TonB-linked outer membrane protein [Aquiflexum lacus]|uniref:SusC/RagA family TonB-linked outer membrane protein n=1 Tax=Aquiflexum lacus TaxID=2483805 RepID=UPI001E562352|nr:TonB-dependent receptor [Aquiflexum lacus]
MRIVRFGSKVVSLSIGLMTIVSLAFANGSTESEHRSNNVMELDVFEKMITGKVELTNGEPLPGASILVEGTSIGTVTNLEGEYQFTVPDDAVLIFSFIGYESQKIVVGNRTIINVVMVEDAASLEEVVVVGYGTLRKKDITGAVTSVSGSRLMEVPALNAVQSLQGMAPGVDIAMPSHSPGAAPSIRIRGNRSFAASNEPLLVVDGIPLLGNLNSINSMDIESMEILKDASATAIYGSRGANGVILITTKRGKEGVSQFSYNSYYGIQRELNRPNVMNGAEFAEFRREARRAIGRYPSDVPNQDLDREMFFVADPGVIESVMMGYDESGSYNPNNVRSFNWFDDVTRTGVMQDHQLSFQGGNQKTQVSVSGGYFENKGVVEGFDYNRFTARLTIDHQVNKILKVGGTMASAYNVRNETGNLYSAGAAANPLAPIFDEEGFPILFPAGDNTISNPINLRDNQFIENRLNHFFGTFYTEVQIFDGLKYRVNVGPDFRTNRRGAFTGPPARSGAPSTADYSTDQRFHYIFDNLLYFDKIIADVHKINATFLYSIEEDRFERVNASVLDLPYDSQLWYNLGTGNNITSLGSRFERWALNSYMGRFNYTFKGKYIFTFTGRYDGSSRLAEGRKFNFFPSIALGWNIIDEPFMANSGRVSELKIRTSAGNTGNTAVSPYSTLGSLSRTVYSTNDNPAFGFQPNLLFNPLLGWENTFQYNIGIDFGFFENKIQGSVELYQQNTTDLILSRQLPAASGFTQITQNVGSTRNTGIEASLSAEIISSPKSFNWNMDLVFFSNKEEIIELAQGKVDDVGSRWFIGQPINTFFDFRFDGIWQNTEADLEQIDIFNATGSSFAPGEIRVADTNGDGVINADDRVILGSTVPRWSGSITNRFNYRGFDLSFMVFARIGQMLSDANAIQYEGRRNWLNVNYWTPDNPSNEFPRPRDGRQVPLFAQALNYQDGSFVRVRQITLGYNLPPNLLNTLKMSQCRVYLSAQNPFLFTSDDFRGIDPEGATGLSIPSVKTYMVGLNLTF